MTYSIELNDLSKTFKSFSKGKGISASLKSFFVRNYKYKSAVDNFNLKMSKGEILALLGPNGAGKTTLMKMMTGIIVPTGGELKVLGHVPWKRNIEFRRSVGMVMGQKSQLWWDIPAIDSFSLLQKYYEISDAQFSKRLEYLGTILDVTHLFNVHIKKLSLGERMKMELMASLLHNPKILFLDEPTIGLDIVSQDRLRDFIKTYHREHQCSIILTSHYMADIEALCSRLVLILNGQKYFDGHISDFKNICGKNKQISFHFSCAQNQDDLFFAQYSPVWNNSRKSVEISIPDNNLKEITIQILNNYPIIDFSTEKLPIERIMKNILKNPAILNAKFRQGS